MDPKSRNLGSGWAVPMALRRRLARDPAWTTWSATSPCVRSGHGSGGSPASAAPRNEIRAAPRLRQGHAHDLREQSAGRTEDERSPSLDWTAGARAVRVDRPWGGLDRRGRCSITTGSGRDRAGGDRAGGARDRRAAAV